MLHLIIFIWVLSAIYIVVYCKKNNWAKITVIHNGWEIRCTLQRQILEDTKDYTCRNNRLNCLSVLYLGIILLFPFSHSKDKSVQKFKGVALVQQFGKLTFGNSFNWLYNNNLCTEINTPMAWTVFKTQWAAYLGSWAESARSASMTECCLGRQQTRFWDRDREADTKPDWAWAVAIVWAID